jgi:UDP-3-O-[3-hydroxymyristoyl] glucosamine N-acyltransferase
MLITIKTVASHLNASVVGDDSVEIDGFASLENLQAGKLVFITKESMLARINELKPTALITRSEWLPNDSIPAIIVDDPYVAYANASQLFARKKTATKGVHASATISASAKIGDNVAIGAGVVIEDDVVVGSGVAIGAGTVIGHSCNIGAGTVIASNVTFYHDVTVGEACEFGSGTVIGGDGFGFARYKDGWQPISQNGGVQIGDRVRVGCNTTIDCGAIDPTHISNDVIIDNLVQIAHNVEIGEFTAIAGCAGIAGSTKIGRNCLIAGAAGITGHIEICDGVQVGGQSRVTKSITKPGVYVSGTPLLEDRLWKKAAVKFSRSAKQKS